LQLDRPSAGETILLAQQTQVRHDADARFDDRGVLEQVGQ
jgi:hypothetical protein